MNKENFSNYLPGFEDKTNNPTTSRSFLNVPDNNLYNGIYCPALVDGKTMGFITKKNFRFTGDKNPVDKYYYNANQSSPLACLKECRRTRYCAAYDFDNTKTTNNCTLYNNFPNSYSGLSNNDLGYRINSRYDFNKLKNNQKKNIWKKCGTQWLAKKYKINEDNFTECVDPILQGDKLRGYDVKAECLWNKLDNENKDLKKTVYKQNYLDDPNISLSKPNSDIDNDIKNFYSKINNNVVFF